MPFDPKSAQNAEKKIKEILQIKQKMELLYEKTL
jgi:hypothetical protein